MEIIAIYLALLIIPLISTLKIDFFLNKYKNKKNKRKLTGCEVAHDILDSNDLTKVYVVANRSGINKYYSDRKVIKLADDVFDENTIYSLAIGSLMAHEALDDYDKTNKFIHYRDYVYDTVNMGNVLSYILMIIGIVISSYDLMFIALALLILCFAYNALVTGYSRKIIVKTKYDIKLEGYIDKDEINMVNKVLDSFNYIYFTNMIKCVNRIVDLFIPSN